MEEIYKALIYLKDYCYSHKCDINCCFYIPMGGCEFRQNKMPRFWKSNDTIIKGMHAQELQPVVEKESDDSENV